MSPWRDHDGNLQAVGRWVRREEGHDEFCGLGLLRLPDMTVTSRITLDVLPTGKPCWVPGRPGEILFPAGDGQLYRCKLGGHAEEERPFWFPAAITGGKPRPRQSACGDLGGSSAGFGCGLSRRSDLVVRTGGPPPGFRGSQRDGSRGGHRVILPSRLWWLAMNDEGDAILAAGRLISPVRTT